MKINKWKFITCTSLCQLPFHMFTFLSCSWSEFYWWNVETRGIGTSILGHWSQSKEIVQCGPCIDCAMSLDLLALSVEFHLSLESCLLPRSYHIHLMSVLAVVKSSAQKNIKLYSFTFTEVKVNFINLLWYPHLYSLLIWKSISPHLAPVLSILCTCV